jgi:group I intron endonuclease
LKVDALHKTCNDLWKLTPLAWQKENIMTTQLDLFDFAPTEGFSDQRNTDQFSPTLIGGGIYFIKCNANSKIYIGQSVDIKRRFAAHINLLNTNQHFNIYLQRSWAKYGKQFFVFGILELVEDRNMMNDRELYWIKRHNASNPSFGFNVKIGGNVVGAVSESTKRLLSNIFTGRKFSQETIERMRVSAIERCKCPKYREKIAQSHRGKKLSPEHVEKIRLAGIGRVLTQSDRDKISAYHKGKKKKPEAVAKMALSKSKRVFCTTNNTHYPSQREAARALGLQSSKVSSVCRGEYESTCGYKFIVVQK